MAVIARCLAFLCLDRADMRTEKVGAQAEFLERLGFNRQDAAKILSTARENYRGGAGFSKRKG